MLFRSNLRSLKYDQYLFWIDSWVGQPSFELGRLCKQHFWLAAVAYEAYVLLPVVIVCVFGVYLWKRPEKQALTVYLVFLINLIAAVPLYMLLPACGPKYVFEGYPWIQPVHLVPHPILSMAPPNCVPSVHTSSALLILWFLAPWKWGRIFGSVYLVLMIVATLGLGEHYLFDLVCAVPYSVAVCWIAQRVAQVKRQRREILVGS